jgi:clan AA aspartic protease (TIGR02281 family)
MTKPGCFSRRTAARRLHAITMLACAVLGATLSACYPGGTVAGTGQSAAATDVIAMTRHGGIFTVPAEINGAARLDFIIDSGSTDVVLPAEAIVVMLRTGLLSENDFIGHAGYRLADGSVLVSPRFKLREVRIGNHAVYDVTASVGEVEGLPLLGESYLSRVSSWAIDNNRHDLVLTGPDATLR